MCLGPARRRAENSSKEPGLMGTSPSYGMSGIASQSDSQTPRASSGRSARFVMATFSAGREAGADSRRAPGVGHGLDSRRRSRDVRQIAHPQGHPRSRTAPARTCRASGHALIPADRWPFRRLVLSPSGRTQLTAKAAALSSIPAMRAQTPTPIGSPSRSASQSRYPGMVPRKCSIVCGSIKIQRMTAFRIRAIAAVSVEPTINSIIERT